MEEKINILMVDDRPENLLALEAIIENDEYQLMKASSGEEALKYLMKYDFAVILLDVQMPGMDGIATAKIIKAREKTKHIPILFITANYMDAEHIFMGYSAGAIDYLLKPFDPIVLKTKVEGFVDIYKMKRKLTFQAEELEERNRIIEYMAFHDSLTDLPNRRLFHEQLLKDINHSRKTAQSLGVMYLDLDRFKNVNDSLGHIVGDKLLKEVAKRLNSVLRDEDIVARVGGDEFNILVPETDREEALDIAEQVLDAFREPFTIDHYELYITTCIGLSIFPYDGEDSTTLLKNADAALYHAKEHGKNKYRVFHSGMNIHSYRTFLMQNDLRKAVERNELELVFQPKFNIETGQVTGAESLLRWHQPNWGTVSPNEFIPIAEETGQIVEIGNWVLREACRQINTWKANNLAPVRVAINFSGKQFLQKDLIEQIQEVIKEFNIEPELLEFEITESVILGNEEIITQTLQGLRKMGIRISLDDFGTGFSSLNYLRRFHFDTLKIDKSFIQDISRNREESSAIIHSIVLLAKPFNMTVIAEGIETEEQLNILANLACHEGQGYLYSRPISSREFEGFLRNNNEMVETKEKSPFSKIMTIPKKEVPERDSKQDYLDLAMNNLKVAFSISAREMDVFKLMMNGLSNKEISEQLFISEHTVKNHITRILNKLSVTDRVQAIALVYETSISEREKLIHY